MKLPRPPHRWVVTPKEAIAIQKELAPRVIRTGSRRRIRWVAGVDAAFSPDGERCLAGVVLWDRQARCVVEQHGASRRLTFPYVPGLLTFREAPAILSALRKLERKPDAIIFDGHGVAHPRRFGIASHVGVVTNLVTIGCAKSRLVGEHDEPAARRGSMTSLHHRKERIGTLLRTRDGVKPVYVSVGHRIDLSSAEQVVLDCATGFRLPEPTRLADRLVAAMKRADIHEEP